MKVLVAEPLAEEGVEALRRQVEVDVRVGLSRDDLLATISDYDAIVIRSQTKLDHEAISKAERLKVIGRAGVGVDNIDLDVATKNGILVVNAPQSNVLSNAEHTMALLLTMSRHVLAADASLRSGSWEREKFTGVELHGKTLGVAGLGRVGTLVAQRASSFGMRIVACDPYVSKNRASQLGIELVPTIEDLCREADFISVHVTKTSETTNLLGDRQFAAMKPGVRIINTSRGGVIDEDALLRGLKEGRVAGAALDVFEEEPPRTDYPLFDMDNVVVTPHIGGHTEEAQSKAGTAIADQVLLALRGEFVPYAVNLQAGTEFVEALRPYIPLTEKLGRILTGISGGRLSTIHFEFHGTVAEHDTRILTLAGLKGLFDSVVTEPVTFVNAPLLAKDRGIEVKETKSALSRDFVNLVVIRTESDEGPIGVGGALVGKRDQERIVRVYEYEIDMVPERYMCFLRYKDVPGVIGKVGTVLGDSKVNIASMQVSRENIGGEALMGLTVDQPIPSDTLERIVLAIEARDAKFIDLGA
jgi:D-3-phosphoglycerate dehydrogenase